MKKLWFARLPRSYDPACDIPFGICSALGDNIHIVDVAERCLNPIDSIDDLIDSERIVADIYWNHFLPRIANQIETQFGDRKPKWFWSIVTSPWLMFLLQVCFLNYQLLKKYKAIYYNEYLEVVIPGSSPFSSPPRSTAELVSWLRKHDLHAWIASRYLLADLPAKWNVHLYQPEKICDDHQTSKKQLVIDIKCLKNCLIGYLKKLRCSHGQIPIGVRVLLSFFLSIRRVHPRFICSNKNIAYACNNNYQFLYTSFVQTTNAIVDKLTPIFYRKDFLHAYSQITRMNFKSGFGRIVTYNIYDDISNLIKACAAEAGEVVFNVQHGGGYGRHKVFPLTPESEYLGGPFITWGWCEHESYKVEALPLPSPLLSRLQAKREKAKRTEDILFVGTDMSPYILRIHSKPVYGHWIDYRNQKIAFLSELSSSVRQKILYRGYYTGTFEDERFLLNSFPDLKICNGDVKAFWNSLLTSRICVVDHPITTLHQSLAMNIPTVAFWNHEHWVMARQAIPFFEELEQVGIIHKTAKEAAQFLNHHFDQIEAWWERADVQRARQHWCKKFARTSKHWLADWIRTLWGKPYFFV